MKEKQIIPLMFCFDTHYVIPAAVAFYSLLENIKKSLNGGGGI
ncbi:glycosyltransferase family 8 protein [Helicobacter sp. 13S00477-4]|nr:glycosyltransferase family 8 protein [Helicobacter sp. 13S00477-4]